MIKRSRIKQRICSSQGQKISLTLLIVGVFFFAQTFAAETTTEGSKFLEGAHKVISDITKLMSWIWIVLATLAGKFMTNDMVYGSWLHLDAYLRKLRNICKNFANFGLLGFLLWEIIQFITKKTGNIQDVVKKSVIAGILIQASWFIVAVLLDVSTIATSAIASFPTQFIDANPISKDMLRKEIGENMKPYTTIIDKNWNPTIRKDGESSNADVEKLLEKIMPKNDSVAGPLVYIWATTLKIQNVLDHPPTQDPTTKKIITTSLLQFLMIGIYTISLVLLLVANIIRIGLLRVIIPLSPILMLMFTFGKEAGKQGIAKNFNVSVILHAIFKPVIFTAALSLVMVFIVSMQNIMISGNDQSFRIQGTTFSYEKEKGASMEVDDLSKTTINDTVFTQASNIGKNIFSNMIIYFSTIFLLWYVVKIALKSGGGTIGDAMSGLTERIEETAKLTPIFPVGGGYSWNALGKTSGQLVEATAKGFNMDTEGRWRQTQNKKFKNKINEMLGTLSSWEVDDRKLLEKAKDSNDSWAFFKETNRIINEEGRQGGLNIAQSEKRRTLLEERLRKEQNKTWDLKSLGFSGRLWEGEESLDTFLKKDKNRKVIDNTLNKDGKIKVNSYEDFENAVYGKKQKEE